MACCDITTSDAGEDQIITTNYTQLEGNAPLNCCAKWILVSGSGTIINPKRHNTKITNLGAGENVFKWKMYNDCCEEGTVSIDFVTIYVDTVPGIFEVEFESQFE